MDYQLSEDEFNSIYSCMHQMDLMASLCAYVPQGHHAVPTAALESFLCTQHRALQAAINAVEGRKDAERVAKQEAAAATASKPEPMPISANLLVRIMDVCSGGVRGEKAVMELHNELYDATIPHGEGEPLKALYLALRRQGFVISSTTTNGVLNFTIKHGSKPKKAAPSQVVPTGAARKRDKLVAA